MKLLITILKAIGLISTGCYIFFKLLNLIGLELIREEWYLYLIGVVLISIILSNALGKKHWVLTLICFFCLLITFYCSNYINNDYIQLQSPLGSYQLIVKDGSAGFETGASLFYHKKGVIFKKYMGMITAEKWGGLIGSGREQLTWLGEDILLVEFFYNNDTILRYKLNFRNNTIHTY